MKKLHTISFLFLFLAASNVSAQQNDNNGLRAENPIVQSGAINPINKIDVYPNPAVEFIIIEIKNSELENTEFELHSIIGNKVDIEPEEIGQDIYRIPVKSFSTGYYFLVVKDEITRYKKAFKFLKK